MILEGDRDRPFVWHLALSRGIGMCVSANSPTIPTPWVHFLGVLRKQGYGEKYRWFSNVTGPTPTYLGAATALPVKIHPSRSPFRIGAGSETAR